MSTIGQTTYADMKQMETLLMKSELDWTVVRASGLFETPAVTDYQVAEDHIRGQFTSREDLADFMLQQLATDQYSRKIIAVATFSAQPSMVNFMLQEAFKEPTAVCKSLDPISSSRATAKPQADTHSVRTNQRPQQQA